MASKSGSLNQSRSSPQFASGFSSNRSTAGSSCHRCHSRNPLIFTASKLSSGIVFRMVSATWLARAIPVVATSSGESAFGPSLSPSTCRFISLHRRRQYSSATAFVVAGLPSASTQRSLMVELRNADGHSRLSLATFFSNQKPSRPWYCRQQLPRAPIEMGFDRAKRKGGLSPPFSPLFSPRQWTASG